MRAAAVVYLEEDEQRAISEARVAVRVGDPAGERDVKKLTGLASENGPISRERLDKAQEICQEVLGAVRKDIRDFYEAADPDAPPISEGRMAFVIVEARERMERRMQVVERLLARAQEMAEPRPTRPRREFV